MTPAQPMGALPWICIGLCSTYGGRGEDPTPSEITKHRVCLQFPEVSFPAQQQKRA